MPNANGVSPRRKVVLIGLDACDLEFIECHRAVLPNLDGFLSGGTLQRLGTTSELLTGSVWPTFYGAVSPGEHGIYHHLQWDPDRMNIRRVSEAWLYQAPFWYDAADHGRAVTVVDVPMMFPSRLAPGERDGKPSNVEVVNWGSHDQLGGVTSNHADLLKRLRARFGKHPMGAEVPVEKRAALLAEIHKNLLLGVTRKGELVRWMMETTSWDWFLGVFGETHRGGHILWPTPGDDVLPADALRSIYQRLDEELGLIVEKARACGAAVHLFALHGMQQNCSQEHFVPAVMDSVNRAYRGEDARGEAAQAGDQNSLMRKLRESLPPGLQHFVARLVPAAVRDWVVSRATASGYDWQQTPGFALLADYNGYIRFNLSGRERDGSLPEAGVADYGSLLAEQFGALEVASDAVPLVADIVDVRARYQGGRDHLLPDRVVTWQPSRPETTVRSERTGTIEAQIATGRSGNHRHQGFVLSLDDATLPPIADIRELGETLRTELTCP